MGLAIMSCLIIDPAEYLFGGEFWRGIKTALDDGKNHTSPDSGLPIAAPAGSLRIGLGGPRKYGDSQIFYGYPTCNLGGYIG